MLLFFVQNIYCQESKFYSSTIVKLLSQNNDTINNVFTGGLNACQYGKIKLNTDNVDDLVIFDRSSGILTTYLFEKNTYIYHPEFQIFFPPIVNWAIFRDYDLDGKVDIFTHTSAGIKVFKNKTTSNGLLKWELVIIPLLSKGFSGMINIQINGADLPAIEDIDLDGDLDILCFNFFNGSQIEYHLNTSIDNFGHADSLTFKRVDDCWGGIEEISCGKFNFGLSCETGLRVVDFQRIKHVAASALLAINLDGDNDLDLLLTKEECISIGKLTNVGTNSKANFLISDTIYPDDIKRIYFPKSASSFYLDVDHDDVKDLMVSSNSPTNNFNTGSFANSSWLYKNIGTNVFPKFQFIQNDFIQSTTIDVGENASPFFVDIDGDTDLDLIIGNRGKYDTLTKTFFSTLKLYSNLGTISNPILKLTDHDYLGFGFQARTNIKPYFVDLNNDEALDLVYISILGNTKELRYILNTNVKNQPLTLDISTSQLFTGISILSTDNLCFTDLNQDGLKDLLIGKIGGNIEYWVRNSGSISFTLSTNNFGGLNVTSNRTCSSPAVFDFNDDGKDDLLLTDNSGFLYLYENVLDIASTNVLSELDTVLVNTNPYASYKNARIGNLPTINVADLNNDNVNEIYVGGISGGLISLSKINEKEIIPIEQDTYFRIYPNPTFKKSFFIEAEKETSCDIYDLTGKLLIDNLLAPSLSNKEYQFPNLNAGVYLIKAKNSLGIKVYKVVIL